MFVKMIHDINRRIDAKINSTISTVLKLFVCAMFVGKLSIGIGLFKSYFMIAARYELVVTLMLAPSL